MASTYTEKKKHRFKLDSPAPPRAERRAVEVASIEITDPEGRLVASKKFEPPAVIPVGEVVELSYTITENDVLRLEAPLRRSRRRKRGLSQELSPELANSSASFPVR